MDLRPIAVADLDGTVVTSEAFWALTPVGVWIVCVVTGASVQAQTFTTACHSKSNLTIGSSVTYVRSFHNAISRIITHLAPLFAVTRTSKDFSQIIIRFSFVFSLILIKFLLKESRGNAEM